MSPSVRVHDSHGRPNGQAEALKRIARFALHYMKRIDPFEDGNGRVGRAIVDLALAQDARQGTRLHGVSAELRRRQMQYYDALNKAQRGTGDVTEWLEWFLDVYTNSCRASSARIDECLVRNKFWSEHRDAALNARQRKALDKMLEAGPGRFEGGLTLRKYVSMTRTSRATAFRDVDDLVKKGMLVAKSTGRATYYDLAIQGWEWQPSVAAGALPGSSNHED